MAEKVVYSRGTPTQTGVYACRVPSEHKAEEGGKYFYRKWTSDFKSSTFVID